MLPLIIVVLVLNLFLMLNWLVSEPTVKGGDKAILSGHAATDLTLQPQSKPQSKPQPKPKPQSKPPVPAKFLAGSGKPGYRVQIFALASDAAVRKVWPRLQKAHPDLLGGLKLKVVRTTRGPRQGIVYRMQVGTLSSAAAARKLCDRLRKRKLDCIIVRS